MRHISHLLVPAPWASATLGLREEQAHHLRRVLRLRSGAAVTCTDGVGRFCEGRLEGSAVTRTSESVVARPTPLLTVAVAPPHATARARFIVEKLVELGIDRLVWLQTRRGRGRAPQREKAQSWATAALEPSRGCWLMEIASARSLASLVASGSTVVAEAGGCR